MPIDYKFPVVPSVCLLFLHGFFAPTIATNRHIISIAIFFIYIFLSGCCCEVFGVTVFRVCLWVRMIAECVSGGGGHMCDRYEAFFISFFFVHIPLFSTLLRGLGDGAVR